VRRTPMDYKGFGMDCALLGCHPRRARQELRRSPLATLFYQGMALGTGSLAMQKEHVGMRFLLYAAAGSAVLLLVSLWIARTPAHAEGNLL
jgi:hypothetical protein